MCFSSSPNDDDVTAAAAAHARRTTQQTPSNFFFFTMFCAPRVHDLKIEHAAHICADDDDALRTHARRVVVQ